MKISQAFIDTSTTQLSTEAPKFIIVKYLVRLTQDVPRLYLQTVYSEIFKAF